MTITITNSNPLTKEIINDGILEIRYTVQLPILKPRNASPLWDIVYESIFNTAPILEKSPTTMTLKVDSMTVYNDMLIGTNDESLKELIEISQKFCDEHPVELTKELYESILINRLKRVCEDDTQYEQHHLPSI